MLRITLVSQDPQVAVLKIAGWLAGDGVALLEKEVGSWFQKVERLILNLKGVQYIDEAGIAALQRWSGERMVLCEGSLFVQTLLRTYGLA